MRKTSGNRSDREVAKSIALNLPDVELNSHHGKMDIRVRHKIFATFPPDGKVVVLKCTPENMALMTKQNPQAFSRAGGQTWVQVSLDEIDRATLHNLLIDSWELAAPAELRRMYEGRLR